MNTNATLDSAVQEAKQLYGVDRWAAGYFDIANNGDVVVNAPTSNGVQSVSLKSIVSSLEERDFCMPLNLRLENLVDDRIRMLNEGFARAIEQSGYQNHYRGVFPIKVNQQQHVVGEIARYGEYHNHGLEAGSKAELLIALASTRSRDSLIICNGYKDEEFVDLGLQAIKLGFKCFFVIETESELDIILKRSAFWNINPLLGARLKLSTKVDGHWSHDSGERSIFGLSTAQLINVVDKLRDSHKLDCLKLLHFHLGSQIPNIRNIRDGVREACRYYIDLIQEGAQLEYFDLGGGLAINYAGPGASGDHGCNYTLDEYCVDIVEVIKESLDARSIDHPVIVSESGRATVAPMSILLFNILDVSSSDPSPITEKPEFESLAIENLWYWYSLPTLSKRDLQEAYNDAFYYRDQVHDAFKRGAASLRERSVAENLCYLVLHRVAALVPELQYPSEELLSLEDWLADIYYCNFSVFQSLPDAWAIQQVFPVMPIHRLNEKPERRAVLADLTCDCDGKLDNFVINNEASKTIPLHKLADGEEYYLGVFLVGAYQETLGDLHNLFGDTHVASVRIDEEGGIQIQHELEGDTIADVLSYVEYNPKQLYQQFLATAEQAVREKRINTKERQTMLKLFNSSLQGYTYFER